MTAVSLSGQCTATDTADVILDMVVDISDSVSVVEDCISLTITQYQFLHLEFRRRRRHEHARNNGSYTSGAPGTYTVTFTERHLRDRRADDGQPDSVPFNGNGAGHPPDLRRLV
ncbi:MAG: hypothetical protein R3D58_02690 [Saprospiraceae bacterium]